MQALQGTTETLKHCQYVLAETVFEGAYEQEPLFDELCAHLQQLGNRFLRPLSFVANKAGSIVQADSLFQRREPERQPTDSDLLAASDTWFDSQSFKENATRFGMHG